MLVQILDDRYHEQSMEAGITETGSLIELFVSEEEDTWTLTVVDPNGISCVIAVGESWQKTSPPDNGA